MCYCHFSVTPTITISGCESGDFVVVEKQRFVLKGNILAYPDVSKIKWKKPDGSCMPPCNNSPTAEFQLKRGEGGIYTCEATNPLGTGKQPCNIDVQCMFNFNIISACVLQ